MSDPLLRLPDRGVLVTMDRLFQLLLVAGCWLYLAGVLVVWLLIRQAGDRWWLATVMLFGPRWVWLFPLFVLVPIGLIRRQRCRTLVPLGLAAAVVVFGPMRFSIPWPAWSSPASAATVRVLSCNVKGNSGGHAALYSLIVKIQPDVVLLQECPDWDTKALERLFPGDWSVERAGNLLVATRFRIVESQEHRRSQPPSGGRTVNGLFCRIESPQGRLGVCSVHLRTPREGLYTVLDRRTGLSPGRSGAVKDEIELRRIESQDLSAWIRGMDDPTVVAGDFNMPVESAIYRAYWSDWGNAFDQAGWGFGTTKITRVRGIRYGLRIDHILLDPSFRARRAIVTHPIGSDHLPVMAEFGER